MHRLLEASASHTVYYSALDGEAEYCDERVCLSVCPSVCVSVCSSVHYQILGTTRPIFTKFIVHVTCGRGSVLLWRRSDTLRSTAFMNDVIFGHKPTLLGVAAQLKRSAHAALGLAISCAQ